MNSKDKLNFDRILELELLDVEKFVKINMLEPITNPIYFERQNLPTNDGLLSNAIFGTTQYDRANTFAYIDLHKYFLNPLIYKKWSAMDKRIDEIIYGRKRFIINSDGDFVENEAGETGMEFIRKNMDKIKIRRTGSDKRDTNIKFIQKHKDVMFMNKLIVIPAYYRDVNSGTSNTGVGEINKLYNNVILSVRSLKETQDYGISLSDMNIGRIQHLIECIYNWFTAGAGLDGVKKESIGLSKKGGIIRSSVMSKTTDYGSRLVLSAPTIRVETVNDLEVDLDYCSLPLASAAVNLFPYLLFNLKRFFENEFATGKYPVKNKNGEIEYLDVKNHQIEFSEEKIKKQIDRFIKGYANRFVPIRIPLVDESRKIFMKFKGRKVKSENVDNIDNIPLMERDLTWCDLIYIYCTEAARDKHALITRYPLDDYFNQFPNKIRIASTVETEPMIVNDVLYKNYPKIRQEDIGTNTSNKFRDSLNISNVHLASIGGDYDGDQTTVKIAYLKESNEELDKFMNSKAYLITIGCKNIRGTEKEGIQAVYQLTKVNDMSKLTNPF